MTTIDTITEARARFNQRMSAVEAKDFAPRTRISDPNNPFVLTEKSYVRDIHPVKHAVDQAAWHLHVQAKIPYSHARTWMVEKLRAKTFDVRNPRVQFLQRGDNGDRQLFDLPIIKYLEEVIENQEILAPTFTTYIATSKYESVLAGYILMNINKRARAKKEMFAAKQAGDTMTEFFKNLEQRNTKLSNNSISGAHASSGNALNNQTNHSTLTSNCRMTSGAGNANNEKLLSGNRHYWAPYIVIANIVSITQNTEYDKFDAVMQKYDLHYPSVDEVVSAIRYSSDMYWSGNLDHLRIYQLVGSLTPTQRAAFLYTGDLYHMAMYNREFVHNWIGRISSKSFKEHDAPHEDLDKLPEDYVNLARQICEKEWAGEGKKYKEMFKNGLKNKLDGLLATANSTLDAVNEYADFIRVMFVSDNIPASIPYFPQSIRRAALTSDTDSTIFTVQWWITWYYGNLEFGERGSRVGASMIFIASQAIIHILARYSIHAGVDPKHMWLIAMKNEFYFPIFSPTEVAKHYWAKKSAQEGNIYREMEDEIKGVHLKSSNAPKEIIEQAQKMMSDVSETVMRGEQIDLYAILTEIADVERSIISCFKKADPRYSRRGQIQTKDSYSKGPTESNYMRHIFWQEVFAPKYGFYEEPPYAVVKLSGALNTPRETQEWLEGLDVKFPDTAARVRAWMKKYNKDRLGAFMIPKQITDVSGVPEELMDAINVRKLTADISGIFYLILRNLGYYGLDKKLHMLVSDTY